MMRNKIDIKNMLSMVGDDLKYTKHLN